MNENLLFSAHMLLHKNSSRVQSSADIILFLRIVSRLNVTLGSKQAIIFFAQIFKRHLTNSLVRFINNVVR